MRSFSGSLAQGKKAPSRCSLGKPFVFPEGKIQQDAKPRKHLLLFQLWWKQVPLGYLQLKAVGNKSFLQLKQSSTSPEHKSIFQGQAVLELQCERPRCRGPIGAPSASCCLSYKEKRTQHLTELSSLCWEQLGRPVTEKCPVSD